MSWRWAKVLITVKAYPEVSRKHGPVVCTAGITEEGEWIRLYPIPWRTFLEGRGIPKYSVIKTQVRPAKGEKLGRRESHKVRPGSITIVDDSMAAGGQRVDWASRNNAILPMCNNSVEELWEGFQDNRTSLGLVRPASVDRFFLDGELSELLKERSSTYQASLTGHKTPQLERFHHLFKYSFTCAGRDCKGHAMSCEDWELFESFRKWREMYRSDEVLWEKLEYKYLEWMLGCDLHFFLGTHSMYPSWMIIGLYYPPKAIQTALGLK